MTIVLQESLRGLFYAPYYACADAGRATRGEGVGVRVRRRAGSPGAAPDGLFCRRRPMSAWGGPMRVNQLYETAAPIATSCAIGEAVTRDPFLLVGRERRTRVSRSPTSLGRAGRDGERGADAVALPASTTCGSRGSRSRRPSTAYRRSARWPTTRRRCCAADEADVVQLFQPLAEELRGDQARAIMWYAAATRGPTLLHRRSTPGARVRRRQARRDAAAWCGRSTARRNGCSPHSAGGAGGRRAIDYFPAVPLPAATSRRSARYRDARHLGTATRSCRDQAMSGCARASSPAGSSNTVRHSSRRSTTASPRKPSARTRRH